MVKKNSTSIGVGTGTGNAKQRNDLIYQFNVNWMHFYAVSMALCLLATYARIFMPWQAIIFNETAMENQRSEQTPIYICRWHYCVDLFFWFRQDLPRLTNSKHRFSGSWISHLFYFFARRLAHSSSSIILMIYIICVFNLHIILMPCFIVAEFPFRLNKLT